MRENIKKSVQDVKSCLYREIQQLIIFKQHDKYIKMQAEQFYTEYTPMIDWYCLRPKITSCAQTETKDYQWDVPIPVGRPVAKIVSMIIT